MAGRGPAPKPQGRRARRNADTIAPTILRFEEAAQPELRQLPGGEEWSPATREWWRMWAASPQAELFGPTDWDFLLDTALIHNEVWGGLNLNRLPELRIRVAKFGATPEDRARLRMQFAEADEADAKRPEEHRRPSARERARVVQLKPIDGGQ